MTMYTGLQKVFCFIMACITGAHRVIEGANV